MAEDCFFNWSEIRDATGPCIRPGGSALTEKALEICNLKPGANIADIGCGAGGTLKRLEHAGLYKLTGIDISEPLLTEAAARLSSANLVKGEANALPYRPDFFDAVFCECVLSILNDKIACLREFNRVLKAGGLLVISDVFNQADSSQTQQKDESHELTENGLLVKRGLVNFLTELNFSILLWEDCGGFLKEFAARIILAGKKLPDPWKCMNGKTGSGSLSYFLLIARKGG